MADSLGQLTFGKFKGKDIEDIPTSYLKWVVGEDFFKENKLYKTVMAELKYRERFGEAE